MTKNVRVKRAAKRITNKVSPQRQVTINMADFQFIGSGQSPSYSLPHLFSIRKLHFFTASATAGGCPDSGSAGSAEPAAVAAAAVAVATVAAAAAAAVVVVVVVVSEAGFRNICRQILLKRNLFSFRRV